jgi:hypothetical protein
MRVVLAERPAIAVRDVLWYVLQTGDFSPDRRKRLTP